MFFTEVVGFTLDFEGTLPPGGAPFWARFLILMCHADPPGSAVYRKTEPRGLFLVEHPRSPRRTIASRPQW